MITCTAIRLYEGLDPTQLEATETIGQTIRFAKGQSVFHEGDAGGSMFLVLTGKIAITKSTPSAGLQLLDTVEEGDFFGEMALLDSRPRSANAIAHAPTELREFQRADLDQLLSISPQIMLNMLRRSSERLRTMNATFIQQIVHQEKMSLIGQMASSIIHDFKNPLTVIRMQVEWIGRDDRYKRQADTVLRNVDRIKNMTNDLLDFARGTSDLHYQSIGAAEWIADIAALLQPILDSRHVELHSELNTTEKLWIDSDKMSRAVYNLAINAAQAMGDGGLLTLRVSKPGVLFQIEVIDTGPGIPLQIRDIVFNPFVTYGKKGGTGLGTSIAKKIVEDHRGNISFTTQTGEGTTFLIELPSSKPA